MGLTQLPSVSLLLLAKLGAWSENVKAGGGKAVVVGGDMCVGASF